MSLQFKCPQINNEHDFNDKLQVKDQVIVLIYSTWCPFCLRFLPIFERCAQDNPGSFLLAQDDQEVLADKYEVDVVPTVIFFENGVVSKRLDGVLGLGLNEKQLLSFVKSCGLQD